MCFFALMSMFFLYSHLMISFFWLIVLWMLVWMTMLCFLLGRGGFKGMDALGGRSDEAWFTRIGVHKTVTLLQLFFLLFLYMSSIMSFGIVARLILACLSRFLWSRRWLNITVGVIDLVYLHGNCNPVSWLTLNCVAPSLRIRATKSAGPPKLLHLPPLTPNIPPPCGRSSTPSKRRYVHSAHQFAL